MNCACNKYWTETRANEEREEDKREMTRGSRRWVAGFPGEGCPDLLFRFRPGTEGPQQRGRLPQPAPSENITTTTTTTFHRKLRSARCREISSTIWTDSALVHSSNEAYKMNAQWDGCLHIS
jgi:hypothetical protein